MELVTKVLKSTLASMLVLCGVLAVSSFAQARTLYWTGESAVAPYSSWNPKWDCMSMAAAQGEELARQSCVHDFGIRWNICRNAPIQRTEDMGTSMDDYGNITCKVRVYITVP